MSTIHAIGNQVDFKKDFSPYINALKYKVDKNDKSQEDLGLNMVSIGLNKDIDLVSKLYIK